MTPYRYNPKRKQLTFPVKEAEECPKCGQKTVQTLEDGGKYCTREKCSWDSSEEETVLL